MSTLLILTGQALSLALLGYMPYFCAKKDAALFTAHPADDSYGKLFHAKRFLYRSLAAITISLVGSSPLWGHWLGFSVSMGALLILSSGWFFYAFNKELSKRRHLAYVDRYYISFSETTAFFPDKFLANRAKARYPGPATDILTVLWRISAAKELKDLMELGIFASSICYTMGLTFILILFSS